MYLNDFVIKINEEGKDYLTNEVLWMGVVSRIKRISVF